MIYLFTKSRFNFCDVVINYENVFKIKSELLIIIIQMKNNIRQKHKTLQLKKIKKFKNFHNQKRKKNDKNKKTNDHYCVNVVTIITKIQSN